MEAPMVYPTAPFDPQTHQHDIDDPTAHAGTGENVESSGKSKSVLSKVKRKARKLKDKIKKVTSSSTASTEHEDNDEHVDKDVNDVTSPDGEEVDDGAELYEDDEEEDDDLVRKPTDNQFKYQQLRSIGALDEQGDGSAGEVHDGVPASTLAASPGTYWTSANDSTPISPYKNAGPPDALQATPTKYRNYAADDAPLLVGGEEKTASHTTNGLMKDMISKGSDEERNPLVSSLLPEVKTSNLSSYYEPAEPHFKNGVSDTTTVSDINVPYPADLAKPNPSFGQSSSPTHDKIPVMNEDLSADGKLGVGLSSEDHSGSGKGNLLETSVPEFEELSGYQGSPLVPTEADKLVYRPILEQEPEVGSFLTPLPGTFDGNVYKSNAIAQCLDNTTSQHQDLPGKAVELPRSGVDKMSSEGESDISPAGAYANETGYGGEQKPIFGTARAGALASEQPTDGGISTAPDSEHESWGKWSAEKINNAKDAVDTGFIGVDHNDESKTQANSTDGWGTNLNNAADVEGDADKVHNLQDDDMSKPGTLEYVNKDAAEEEFFNPNEVKDNQFQEGFLLGNAEDDALSGTLAGSAIETLQGLKETVASSLGYSTHDDSSAGGEKRPGFEGEEGVLSPSHQQQKGGFVQGLKETVASSLGYGKAASDEASDKNDVEKAEIDVHNRHQQSGGTLQGLKNAVAGTLGYGMAEDSPAPTEETESREFPAEASSHEPLYDEGADHGSVIKAGHGLSDVGDNAHREDEVSSQQQSGGVLQSMKDMVISKLGYNNQPEEISRDVNHTESVSVPSGDHQPNSYTQKLFDTTAATRDYLSSKVGYGNSNEDKQSAYENDGGEIISPSTHVDNNIEDYNAKSSIASKLSPGEEDKALSELITEKVAGTANMIGEKLRLSGGNQSSNVPASEPQH